MGWVDSHCHLDHARLREAGAVGVVRARAEAAGVSGILTVNCRISDEFSGVSQIAHAYPYVWCTLGTHPHEAGDPAERAFDAERIAAMAQADSKVVAIGECGLDYFYHHSTPEDQQSVFRQHIRAARMTGLPLVIHSRDAEDDTISLLKEEGEGAVSGVMHCFTGSADLARRSLDLGFYISFSGIVTFKKSEELRAIARMVPVERMLIETDAPYLAPEPHRGSINEPAYVSLTGQYLADLLGMDAERFAAITQENFYRLFSRAAA